MSSSERPAAPGGAFHPGLDGVRAFAFLGVFVYHARLIEGGYLGVQVFFVLSGFLLTPILVDLARRSSPRDYFRVFYGRRALRILPLYYFYLLLAAALAPVIAAHSAMNTHGLVRDFFDQLPWTSTFTFDFFHASRAYTLTPLTSHFWSLAVEEQFYLFWPLAILATARGGPRRLLLTLMVLGPVLRAAIEWLVRTRAVPFLGADSALVVYVLPFSYLDAFAAGGWFALYAAGIGARRVVLALAGVVALGLLFQMALAEPGGFRTLGFPFPMRGGWRSVWAYTLLNLAVAALLVEVRAGRFAGLFANRPARYCGRISYGLYVYHLPVIWAWWALAPGTPLHWMVCGTLLTTFVLAALSYELLERRCLSLKDRWFPTTAAPAIASRVEASGAGA